MGLFNRLFGQKPPPDAPSERVRESVEMMSQYLRTIMAHYGDEHFQGDTQAKQILSVYSFGGTSALALHHGMSPPTGSWFLVGPEESDLQFGQTQSPMTRGRGL